MRLSDYAGTDCDRYQQRHGSTLSASSPAPAGVRRASSSSRAADLHPDAIPHTASFASHDSAGMFADDTSSVITQWERWNQMVTDHLSRNGRGGSVADSAHNHGSAAGGNYFSPTRSSTGRRPTPSSTMRSRRALYRSALGIEPSDRLSRGPLVTDSLPDHDAMMMAMTGGGGVTRDDSQQRLTPPVHEVLQPYPLVEEMRAIELMRHTPRRTPTADVVSTAATAAGAGSNLSTPRSGAGAIDPNRVQRLLSKRQQQRKANHPHHDEEEAAALSATPPPPAIVVTETNAEAATAATTAAPDTVHESSSSSPQQQQQRHTLEQLAMHADERVAASTAAGREESPEAKPSFIEPHQHAPAFSFQHTSQAQPLLFGQPKWEPASKKKVPLRTAGFRAETASSLRRGQQQLQPRAAAATASPAPQTAFAAMRAGRMTQSVRAKKRELTYRRLKRQSNKSALRPGSQSITSCSQREEGTSATDDDDAHGDGDDDDDDDDDTAGNKKKKATKRQAKKDDSSATAVPLVGEQQQEQQQQQQQQRPLQVSGDELEGDKPLQTQADEALRYEDQTPASQPPDIGAEVDALPPPPTTDELAAELHHLHEQQHALLSLLNVHGEIARLLNNESDLRREVYHDEAVEWAWFLGCELAHTARVVTLATCEEEARRVVEQEQAVSLVELLRFVTESEHALAHVVLLESEARLDITSDEALSRIEFSAAEAKEMLEQVAALHQQEIAALRQTAEDADAAHTAERVHLEGQMNDMRSDHEQRAEDMTLEHARRLQSHEESSVAALENTTTMLRTAHGQEVEQLRMQAEDAQAAMCRWHDETMSDVQSRLQSSALSLILEARARADVHSDRDVLRSHFLTWQQITAAAKHEGAHRALVASHEEAIEALHQEHRENVVGINEELQRVQAELNETAIALDGTKETLEATQTTLEQREQQLAQQEAETARLQQALREAASTNESLRQRSATLEQLLDKSDRYAAAQRLHVELLRSEHDAVVDEAASARRQVHRLSSQRAALCDQLASVRERDHRISALCRWLSAILHYPIAHAKQLKETETQLRQELRNWRNHLSATNTPHPLSAEDDITVALKHLLSKERQSNAHLRRDLDAHKAVIEDANAAFDDLLQRSEAWLGNLKGIVAFVERSGIELPAELHESVAPLFSRKVGSQHQHEEFASEEDDAQVPDTERHQRPDAGNAQQQAAKKPTPKTAVAAAELGMAEPYDEDRY